MSIFNDLPSVYFSWGNPVWHKPTSQNDKMQQLVRFWHTADYLLTQTSVQHSWTRSLELNDTPAVSTRHGTGLLDNFEWSSGLPSPLPRPPGWVQGEGIPPGSRPASPSQPLPKPTSHPPHQPRLTIKLEDWGKGSHLQLQPVWPFHQGGRQGEVRRRGLEWGAWLCYTRRTPGMEAGGVFYETNSELFPWWRGKPGEQLDRRLILMSCWDKWSHDSRNKDQADSWNECKKLGAKVDSGGYLIFAPMLVSIHNQLDPSLCLIGRFLSSANSSTFFFAVAFSSGNIFLTLLAGTSTTPPLPQFLKHTREKSPIVGKVLDC